MRLLQRFLWQLSAKGLQDRIALITDGRFSGTDKGCAPRRFPEAQRFAGRLRGHCGPVSPCELQ